MGLSARPFPSVQSCIDLRCIPGFVYNLSGQAQYSGVLSLPADSVGLKAIMKKPLCITFFGCPCALEQYYIRNRDRLYLLLICLRLELLRGQLLHRKPLPTIEVAVMEPMAEETHLRELVSLFIVYSTASALATPASSIAT